MNDMSVAEFCDLHCACDEGRHWALATCASMRVAWLLWIATRPGVLDDRTLRLLAVRFARTVEHLMTDKRSRDALAVAQQFANGQATDSAWAAACDAARAAERAAACDAERAAAWGDFAKMVRESDPCFRKQRGEVAS